MGVRSRKKARNKSRYRIASKRRKASAQKKLNPVQQLEEEASKEAQLEKPGVRLTNAQVVYATTMLDKYGDDYKVREYCTSY
ncbi:hypothetical protein E2C01_034557 [Portunus trituberculatus]|uniref:Uncharacterized protein n=1 Tax=Portunus trituberculatus TaxID=210409 RepID=A0A5B7F6X9_PORTR|nr:hypothetical protein [Portunus trituberculatus]